jgi:fructose/tagatose bisphosphate aldolase
MEFYGNNAEMIADLKGVVTIEPFAVTDREKFRSAVDKLVSTAVFGDEAKTGARWIIRTGANACGAVSASIQGLYDAIGRGEADGFTVPAHNLRGLIYDKARAIFRSALALDAGAFIFEIARSEMGYCEVRPGEYSACVLGAAIKEGWEGPVFIQGDHFQFAAKDFFQDPEKVTQEIKDLTKEAVEAGFYNIDIDSSTLVVLDRPTVKEQQRDNYERCAELTKFIRGIEPVEISVGGEIGEVGKKNSTVEEFDAFYEGYRENWDGKPISKMSVQTGTAHGGVIAEDGTRARVNLDFKVLKEISAACRRQGIAGAVQHGASTLPESAFDQFPVHDAVEIHLATEFQRMVFDHEKFPFKAEQVEWVKREKPKEWKEAQTEAQNVEKSIKRTWGPFKEKMWSLPDDVKASIVGELEEKFRTLMTLLKAKGTRKVVDRFVKAEAVSPPKPEGLRDGV